jgi:hypothetical protein
MMRNLLSCLALAASVAAPIALTAQPVKMVQGEATLLDSIDGAKLQPGTAFHAKLIANVQLEGGPVLPMGTVLTGEIVAGQPANPSKLALRFTTATLKNGTTLPIKATILERGDDESASINGFPSSSHYPAPNLIQDGAESFDQTGFVKGVDLHSDFASNDSATFTASPDKDIKIRKGSDIVIALAPAQ